MNLRIYLIGLLITLIGFTACSDDLNPGVDNPNQPENTGNSVQLHINLQTPGAGAVAYSQIWIDNEALVDTLDVYIFSNKVLGGTLDDQWTLEQIVPQDTTKLISSAGAMKLQLQLEGRDADRRLYFIANGSKMSDLLFLDEEEETTEEVFLAALTNATPQSTPLLMTAMVAISTTQLQNDVVDNVLTLDEQVVLRRVSARIDIQNHERLLIIDSVQLFNTPQRSYIFGNAASALEDGSTSTTAWPTVNIRTHKFESDGIPEDTYWAAPERHNDPALGDSVYIPSLYFPYENFADGDKDKRQRLRIWGRIGSGDLTQAGSGEKVIYEVPLQATGDSIARNNRYILLIRNVLGSDLDASLTVKAWESEEGDTIYKEVGASRPKVRTLAGDRLTDKTLDVAQAGATVMLKVDCNIQWAVEFEGEEAAAAAGWITPVITMDEAGATTAGASDIGQYLKLTFDANSTGAERGFGTVWIKVYNKAEPGKMYRFTIRQA